MDARAGATSTASSSDYCSTTSQIFDVMSNEELVNMVEEAKTINRNIYLENDFFIRYLKRNESLSEKEVDNLMQVAAHKEAIHRRLSGILSRHPSVVSLSSSRWPKMTDVVLAAIGENPRLASTAMSTTTTVQKEGPRITLSHKIDMCTREIEVLRVSFEKMTRTYAVRKAHLKAEIEEIQTAIIENQQTSARLEDTVIVKGVDPLSKKIPADVFIRFMEGWLQKSLLLSGQLRLKTDAMKTVYKKLSDQLEEKIELGESIQLVDFDTVKIQITETSKQLQERNLNLTLLKEDTATTHRKVAAFKDLLAEQLAQLDRLCSQSVRGRRRMQKMMAEAEIVRREAVDEEASLARIKMVRATYTVPDIIEYARVKQQAVVLRHDIKMWTRRATLQHSELVHVKKRLKEVKALLFP